MPANLLLTIPGLSPKPTYASKSIQNICFMDLLKPKTYKYNRQWNKIFESKDSTDLNIKSPHEWSEAYLIAPVTTEALLPLQLPEFTSSRVDFKNITARGLTRPDKASLSVEFSQIITTPGTYVAHCSFHSTSTFYEEVFVHCDDSYKLFINGRLANSQGDQRSLNGADPDWLKPMTCLEGTETNSHCHSQIQEGWNNIIVIYYGDHNSAGITINFHNFPASEMHAVQEPAEEPTLGWKLAGPLLIPFSHISGLLNFDQMQQVSYHNLRPCDTSAYLMSLDFTPITVSEEPLGFLELNSSEYVILDLGKCASGTPIITFSGNSGDIIDIIYGELSIDGKLLPFHSNHGRQSDTIILPQDEISWSTQNTRSFRYLAIHIRDAKESCFIKNPALRVIGVQEEMKGKFSSNDETINSIYQVGLQTLESCSKYNFVDTLLAIAANILQMQLFKLWPVYKPWVQIHSRAKPLSNSPLNNLKLVKFQVLAPVTYILTYQITRSTG